MEIRFVMSISRMRSLLKNENYKRHIQDCFMRDGKSAGTLRFQKLEIRKENIIFEFKEVKVGGILYIEWSDIYSQVVKYFGTHEPGKDYYNLADKFRKLKVVEFNPEDKNFSIGWSNNLQAITKISQVDFEMPNHIYFSESSLNAIISEIADKNITREQFLVAYNEVFGGLQ